MFVLIFCIRAIYAVLFIAFVLGVLVLFKNENTCKKRLIIGDAIFAYNCNAISESRREDKISYDVVEKYEKTLFRVWDWGYKNIVPPDVLEKIAPFINKGGRK